MGQKTTTAWSGPAVEGTTRLWILVESADPALALSDLGEDGSLAHSDDPSAFKRANHMKTLHSWSARPRRRRRPDPASVARLL